MEDIEILYREVLEKYPCITYEDSRGNPLNYHLANAIIAYYTFYYGIERKEQSFKFYPITVTEEETERIYKQDIRDIVLESVRSKQPIDILMTNKIQEYRRKIEENKKYALDTPMEPFYGSPNFMFERGTYILNCMSKLPVEIPNLESIHQRLQDFMEKYGNIKVKFKGNVYPFYTEEFKRDYDEFEKAYCLLLQTEKAFSKVAETIWKGTLTDPSKHDDRNFAYLIHTFKTGGMISLENIGKVCCSLATSNLLTPPFGNAGIICDFDSEAVEAICSKDAGSWMITKRSFIDRIFPINWQLTNPEGVGVWFECPQISKLLLPSEVEKDAIERNIKYNGEILNYSKTTCYSEIFLNDKVKAIGVFYTDNCQDTVAIQKKKKKYHLPLVHLSLQKLRENAGLAISSESKL